MTTPNPETHWQQLGIPIDRKLAFDTLRYFDLWELYVKAIEDVNRLKARLHLLGARELKDEEGNICLRITRNIYIDYYKSTEKEQIAELQRRNQAYFEQVSYMEKEIMNLRKQLEESKQK